MNTHNANTMKSNEDVTGQLAALEKRARQLEPSASERQAIARQAFGYIDEFINALPDAPGYKEKSCDALKALTIDDYGKPFDQLLQILRDEVDQSGINSAAGTHMGYIPSGGLWTSAVGDMLAAAANRYVGIFYSSPGAVRIENQLIQWLCTIMGYPATAHGNLSSGGSMASLIAIQTAREARHIDSTNVRKAVVYFTAQAHHCLHKALHITGLQEAQQRIIPMNERYQMDVSALAETLRQDKDNGLIPFLVIGTAGTTDTGAIDPLDAIADLCERYHAWFHVDAAYGGFFMLLGEIAIKFKGIERSDSLVMDPHKSMFLPYGTGVVLVKDAQTLLRTYSHQAAYMQDAYGFDEISPSDCSPELSRHFRGLRMWLPLHLHGVNAFKANLQEKLLLCRYFHEAVSALGFETGPEPDLSITLFRYPSKNSNAFNQQLLKALHADGRCFFSSTQINGQVWIRCAVLSFRTHRREIDLALSMVKESLEKITALSGNKTP
jgi:aromatic-L-amino-acid decarboxylase